MSAASDARLGIVFFGSGAFGLPTLEALQASHRLLGVITQPDRPAGRARKLAPTPIGAWAAEHAPNIPLIKPESVNTPEMLAAVRAFPADAFVVIAFGQKLSPQLLRDRFAINLHASLLPRWRGAAPINHAILAGDEQTGNSVITLADRMDAGEVLGQSFRPITATSTAGELHDELSADGPPLILQVLKNHRGGSLRPASQDSSRVTIAPKLSRRDALMDWSQPAAVCSRRINGLSPWPGVSVTLAGAQLKLLRSTSDVHDSPTRSEGATAAQLGSLINAADGLVMCASGSALRLLEVQPAGGRPMSWSAFSAGRRVETGAVLESLEDHGSC